MKPFRIRLHEQTITALQARADRDGSTIAALLRREIAEMLKRPTPITINYIKDTTA